MCDTVVCDKDLCDQVVCVTKLCVEEAEEAEEEARRRRRRRGIQNQKQEPHTKMWGASTILCTKESTKKHDLEHHV